MNKPNEKQKEIIKFFQKQLSFWEKTNDIDSLTHYTDIGEELRVLNDNLSVDYTSLTPHEINNIESVARTLYQIISKVSPMRDKPWVFDTTNPTNSQIDNHAVNSKSPNDNPFEENDPRWKIWHESFVEYQDDIIYQKTKFEGLE